MQHVSEAKADRNWEGEGGITRPQMESNAAGRVRFSPEAFQKSFPFCIPGI